MRTHRYEKGDIIVIDLPQYDVFRVTATIISFYNDIYEIRLSREVYDQDNNIKTVLFLHKNIVNKNSKKKPKKKKRKPRAWKKPKLLLENPDPENIAFVHKYIGGPFAGETRTIPITEHSKREDRTCPDCGKEFPNSHPNALRQHIFRMHNKSGKYDTWGKDAKKRWKKARVARTRTKALPGNRSPLLWTTYSCATCGIENEIRIREYEKRKAKSISGKLYCCQKCCNKDIQITEIREKLLQQAILDSNFQCVNCGYSLSFDMYYIKETREVGFSTTLENTIVLCKNCRDLWKTGQARIDPETKSLVMIGQDDDIANDYSIDMDEILREIGDVDSLLDEED